MAEYPDRFNELTAKEQELILRYEETLDPYNSALAAGYDRSTARKCVYSWFKQPHLKPALYQTAMHRKALRLETFKVEAKELMLRTTLLAYADPSELVDVRACACRYCHGEGFAYQWTPAEFEKALSEAEGVHGPLPDIAGGMDYDKTADPHPDCPECSGEGVEVIRVKDLRDVSEGARLLYKGAKVSKDGRIEVLMHDQEAAKRFLAQLCGFVLDKKEITGKDGAPLDGGAGAAVLEALARKHKA